MIEGAIFDVDGTLIDSMPVWHDCGKRYLASIGIEAEPELGDILFTHNSESGARYLIEHYKLDRSVTEVAEGLMGQMEEFYYSEAKPKDGAVEFLDLMAGADIPMTVATSTEKYCIKIAFDRLGLSDYFEGIVTCSDVGATKDRPDVFDRARDIMATESSSTWVFEDGLYAVKTARDAGYRTVAVYDEISKKDWNEMTGIADKSVENLTELKLSGF